LKWVFQAAEQLEAISKMSFGPTRQRRINFILLVPCFKSSKYESIPPVLTLKRIKSDGESRAAGKTRLRREPYPPQADWTKILFWRWLLEVGSTYQAENSLGC
jgi:hypothetical protein